MTTFVNKSNREIVNKTVFTHVVNGDKGFGIADNSPEQFDTVELIGIDSSYGAVFKAYDHDGDDFILFFGTVGDEFNS